MVLGSALAKNDDVGVKHIDFVVGVKVGAVGLSGMSFVGVVSALCAGGGIERVGVVSGGGLAMCRRVKRLRCIHLKRTICCRS